MDRRLGLSPSGSGSRLVRRLSVCVAAAVVVAAGGWSPPASARDGLDANPAPAAVGDVFVGQWAPVTVTYSNNSGSAVSVVARYITRAAGLQTQLGATDCPSSLEPGASCTGEFRVKPMAAGDFSVEGVVLTDGDVPNVHVGISGRGVHEGLALSQPAVDFGEQRTDEVSDPVGIEVLNTGTEPMEVVGLGLSGDHAGDFLVQSEGCTAAVVAPGGSCAVELATIPTEAGNRQTSVVVDTMAHGTAVAELRAQGIDSRPPEGGIQLSLNLGRRYVAVVWAVDPDDGEASRIRMHAPDALTPVDPTGHPRRLAAFRRHAHEDAVLFTTRLPRGTHEVCFEAEDNQTGDWHPIGCRSHRVR